MLSFNHYTFGYGITDSTISYRRLRGILRADLVLEALHDQQRHVNRIHHRDTENTKWDEPRGYARRPARIFTKLRERSSSTASPVASASASVNAPLLMPRMK